MKFKHIQGFIKSLTGMCDAKIARNIYSDLTIEDIDSPILQNLDRIRLEKNPPSEEEEMGVAKRLQAQEWKTQTLDFSDNQQSSWDKYSLFYAKVGDVYWIITIYTLKAGGGEQQFFQITKDISKYQNIGFNFGEKILVSEVLEQGSVKIELNEIEIKVNSKYDKKYIKAARQLDGKWDGRAWVYPAKNKESLFRVINHTYKTNF